MDRAIQLFQASEADNFETTNQQDMQPPDNISLTEDVQQVVDPKELQRCLETDLALFMSQTGINSSINNYHFRQLISSLCSGLKLPPINVDVDDCLTRSYCETLDVMKAALRDVQKFVVMANLVHAKNTKTYVICISIAFEWNERLEVLLLGMWEYAFDEALFCFDIQPMITETLERYDLNVKQVLRTLVGGFEEQSVNPMRVLVTNAFETNFQFQLMDILNEVLESSNVYAHIRKRVLTMIEMFCDNQAAFNAFVKETGYVLHHEEISFEKLTWILLLKRDEFFDCCAKNIAGGRIQTLSGNEFSLLEDFFSLRRIVVDYAEVLKNGNYLTIDHIVPQIRNICILLRQCSRSLDYIPLRIEAMIQERFNYLFDPDLYSPDSVFIVATALNPNFVHCLDKNQFAKAKKSLKEMLFKYIYATNNISDKYTKTDATIYADMTDSKLDVKSNLYFDFLTTEASRANQLDKELDRRMLCVTELIESYFHDVNVRSEYKSFPNPISFWRSNTHLYNELAQFALELLLIPVSATLPHDPVRIDEDNKLIVGNSFETNDPFDFIRFSFKIEDLERNAITKLNRNFYYAAKQVYAPEQPVKEIKTSEEIVQNGTDINKMEVTAGVEYNGYPGKQYSFANNMPLNIQTPLQFVVPPPTGLLPILRPPMMPPMMPPLMPPIMPPMISPPELLPEMNTCSNEINGFKIAAFQQASPNFKQHMIYLNHRFSTPVLIFHDANVHYFNCSRIYNLLSIYGHVIKVNFSYSNPQGLCFVQMANVVQAERAFQFSNCVPVFGLHLKIKPSTIKSVTTASFASFAIAGSGFAMIKGGLSFCDYSAESPIYSEKHFVEPTDRLSFSNIPKDLGMLEIKKFFMLCDPNGPLPRAIVHSGKLGSLDGIMYFNDIEEATGAIMIYNNMKLGNLNLKLYYYSEEV